MKKRRFLAALLALSCAASLAVPAYAADQTVSDLGEAAVAVTTTLEEPNVSVTLPTATDVFVNPYRVAVKPNGPSGDDSYDTVISPEMDVQNDSDAAITVGVKGLLQTYTLLSATDVKAAAIDTTDCDITNDTDIDLTKVYESASKAKTYVEVDGGVAKQVTLTYTAPTYNTAGDSTSGVKKNGTIKVTGYTASKNIKVATNTFDENKAGDANNLFMYVQGKLDTDTNWAAYTAAAAKVSANSTTPTSMMVLTAKETANNVLYLGSGEKGQVRVSGNAATSPKTAWSDLKTTDSFDAKFVFVIDAVANKAPVDPNVTAIGLTASNGTLSTYTFDAATKTYNITWTGAANGDTITFAPTESTGAKVTVTKTTGTRFSTSGLVLTNDTGASGDSAVVEVKFENTGKPAVTYTYNVSIA